MDEKMVTVKELQELKEKLVKNVPMDNQDYMKIFQLLPQEQKEEGSSNSKETAKQYAKTNPSIPSLLDKNAGFSNIIYLATMSLVFEVVFLAISFLIFN